MLLAVPLLSKLKEVLGRLENTQEAQDTLSNMYAQATVHVYIQYWVKSCTIILQFWHASLVQYDVITFLVKCK